MVKTDTASAPRSGKLIVISGPSGVGKDTVLGLFRQRNPDWRESPSVTTRQPRAGEVDGKDYYFISPTEFKTMIKKHELLEWVEYTGHFYGTLRQPIEAALKEGRNVIVRKEIQGALFIKDAIPQSIVICLLPDEEEALEKRFRGRATDSEELLNARMELAKEELKFKEHFDHIVINPHNDPEKAVSEIENIAGLS